MTFRLGLIINPTSGRGKGVARGELVLQTLAARGQSYLNLSGASMAEANANARHAINDQGRQHTAVLKVNYAPIEQYSESEWCSDQQASIHFVPSHCYAPPSLMRFESVTITAGKMRDEHATSDANRDLG